MKESFEQTASAPELIRTRMKIFGLLAAVVITILAGRFYYIQIVQHDDYLSRAKKVYTSIKKEQGQRGEIFDRDGNLLVGNSPRWNLSCTPSNLEAEGLKGEKALAEAGKMRERAAILLHKYFPEKTADWYYQKLVPTRIVRDPKTGKQEVRKNQYFLVQRLIPTDIMLRFKEDLRADAKKYGKKKNLDRGIFAFQPTVVRTYPKGRLLANILGYVDIDDDKVVPRSGLEIKLNKEMKPGEVVNVYERTPAGLPLPYGFQSIHQAVDGKSIRLTISEPIQSILEEELEAACKEWNPKTIYAAIADPHTGEILAMAQRPTFDPGDRKSFKSEAVRLRMTEDIYEPGSVAKPFTILKGLEEGVITPDTEIKGEKGYWVYKNRSMKDSHAHETMTVRDIITESSNIGTAKIALMMDPERVYHGLFRFGFGRPTGIAFFKESRGVLPNFRKWNALDATRIPIGYSFQVTLLQLLQAYCGLANNGHIPRLKLIAGTIDQKTQEFIPAPSELPRPTGAAPEKLFQLLRMMEKVTTRKGTGWRAAVKGFQVAGKTGTSRKTETVINPKTGKKHTVYVPKYYCTFAGIIPAEAPRLVMVVTADEPHKEALSPDGKMREVKPEGGRVAAPVFQKTMTRVLRYLNIPPTEVE